MNWAALLFIAVFTFPFWGLALYWAIWPRWERYRDREKNAAGDALADVAIALLNDEPASWAKGLSGSLDNERAGLRISGSYYGDDLYASGVDIPLSPKTQKELRKAREKWAERQKQERIRQALATVGGKLHVINGGRS